MTSLRMMLKAIGLFLSILFVTTCGAAIVACLFLSNGKLIYLLQPTELAEFLWVTRAGLKVTIFYVSVAVFLLCAEDGALGRPWAWPPIRSLGFDFGLFRQRPGLPLRRRPISGQSAI